MKNYEDRKKEALSVRSDLSIPFEKTYEGRKGAPLGQVEPLDAGRKHMKVGKEPSLSQVELLDTGRKDMTNGKEPLSVK